MKLYTFNHSRFCDSTCSFCAREFFNWWKSRNAQMSVVLEGNSTSFAEAAARSVGANLPMATAVASTETSCHTLTSAFSDLALAPF